MGNIKAFLRTALVFLIFELCFVGCDITDGNAEHLKREHSLMKPYQGKKPPLALALSGCSHFYILNCGLVTIE